MKKLLRFTIFLGALTLLLFLLHTYFVLDFLVAPPALKAFLEGAYIFLFILNYLSYITVFVVWMRSVEKAGYVYLGLSLLKLMIAVAFLWRPIHEQVEIKQALVMHFMAPYILLLIAEVVMVQRLLKSEP